LPHSLLSNGENKVGKPVGENHPVKRNRKERFHYEDRARPWPR